MSSLLFFVTAAFAGELSMGVGLGVATDLPDKVSKDYAKFGLGPSLTVPVTYEFNEGAAIRVTPRIELGFGSDRVTWVQVIDNEEVRFKDDDHWAMFVAGGATVGPQVTLPVSGTFKPYFGAEAGISWVGTYHSLGNEGSPTSIIFDPDPAVNDLSKGSNIDPYSTQAVFLTDLHLGGRLKGEGPLAFFVETGYSIAFLGAAELKKSDAAVKARREAFGWNAFRGVVGIGFGL